jgi:23S rRNA (uracil1939-C5)-methyltransferase
LETIHIDSLAYGGYGVGRINSKVVFVSYAVPGDILKIEIEDDRKSYSFGKIVEIITPSPERVAPACKYFGICGGCNYLNIPYEEELRWKTEIFGTEFKKISGNTPDIQSAAGNYLNYRQKIGLKIHPPYIGFYKKSSHDVVDIEYCLLAKESLNALLKNARNLLLDKNNKDTVLKKLKSMTLTDAGIKNIAFEFKDNVNSIKGDGGLPLKRFAEDLTNNAGADNVFFAFSDKKIIRHGRAGTGAGQNSGNTGNTGSGYFTVKDKKFSYDLPSFIQVNKEQNENIINAVTGYLKNVTGKRGGNFNKALDLYCGFGNITLFLAPFADNITGVESSGFSVKLGEKNLALNGIKNIKFIKSDAADFLGKAAAGAGESAAADKKTFDLIVLDPPRAGVKGLVPKIAGLNAECIIYISCDTMTFLRDLKVFAETGYGIERINLTDMFPRTYHMEHIAFLRK